MEAPIQLVTGEEMARIDRRAIAGGIPGAVLMETAGAGVADVLEDLLGGFSGRRVALLCGKGNNGGDGFVVARIASQKNASVRAFLLAGADQVAGDAKFHLDRARTSGVSVEEVQTRDGLARIRQVLAQADAAVDALLGTGIRGAARGLVADGIDCLSSASCPVVAVDVPSGLDAETGRAEGPCVAAACTVSFGLPKRGQFFYPGRALCGRLHIVDIGLPAVEAEPAGWCLIAGRGAAPLLPKRPPDAHKGDCGRVVVLAGSVGLTGAAALAGGAAMRGGAGLVMVGVPESLNDIVEIKLTEAMTRPLPEVRKARCLSLRARGEIARLLEKADCVALGPGLGVHRETVELVRRLLGDIRIPMVLDADALNALAGEPERLGGLGAPAVITPHPGEFCRLTGADPAQLREDPAGPARDLARAAGVTVVLKGAPAVVATPGGRVWVNPSGNAGMATGGSGDVLTGLLAALIGQGLDVETAACLGVYLHGLAGDLAADARGQAGLVASDILAALPDAERVVRDGKDPDRYLQFHSKGQRRKSTQCPIFERASKR